MALTENRSLPLVLVAHRGRDTVDLLKGLLEGEGFPVLCAYNGRAALQYAHQHHPALLLVDQALPLVDGLELCRTLRQESSSSAIFIVSDRPDELGKLLAFTAGADDCLTIPFHPRELLARVKAVLRRVDPAPAHESAILRSGALELDTERRQVRGGDAEVALTVLEYELLSVLMRQPGRVFSREQLIGQLQGFQQHEPVDRAVDIHVSNLRRKLRQVLGDAVPIETVRGVGYRFSATETKDVPEGPAAVAETLASLSQGQLAFAAFERAPMPLLVLGPDRTVLLYNEAARQLCGWPTEQVVGQTKCYSLLLCHNPDGTMLCHDQCVMRAVTLNRIGDQTTRYAITLRDGREIPVVAHYSSLGASGVRNGYVLLTLDPDFAGAQLP